MADVDMKFVSNADKILRELNKQVDAGLYSIAEEAVGFAMDECPIDTSRLINSLDSEVKTGSEKAVYIGTDVKYAKYVEFNDNVHHEIGNAHFLRNAATKHGKRYSEIMKEAMQGKNL